MTWIQEHAYGIWLVGLGLGLALVLSGSAWLGLTLLRYLGFGRAF
jgi:hypothetical protein